MPLVATSLSSALKPRLKTILMAQTSDESNNPESALDAIAQEFADAIAETVVQAIKTDALYTIPTGAVIIAVAGQAVGTPNPAPLPITVT